MPTSVDLSDRLGAGQVWTVRARSAGGIPETYRLRLTTPVEPTGRGSTAWDAALEGSSSLHDVTQVRLTLLSEGAGHIRLGTSVLSFDGRSQPDLRICMVTDLQETAQAMSWSGVYGVGLSGSRAVNAYLSDGQTEGLGTCTLSWHPR